MQKVKESYFKKCEAEMDRSISIVLLDFAENFKFVVQDEVQSYHWNSQQCILHPIVVYYKDVQDNWQEISLCIPSFMSSEGCLLKIWYIFIGRLERIVVGYHMIRSYAILKHQLLVLVECTEWRIRDIKRSSNTYRLCTWFRFLKKHFKLSQEIHL